MLKSLRVERVVGGVAACLAVACGGGEKAAVKTEPAAAPSVAAEVTPDPGGKVITVQMITDGTGNYFKPADFAAHPGDVVRFTLTVGVHNVHFLADSNPGATGLPPAGELLQLPGQKYDLKVSLKPGTYFYQCDAHAALGMKGHLKVEK